MVILEYLKNCGCMLLSSICVGFQFYVLLMDMNTIKRKNENNIFYFDLVKFLPNLTMSTRIAHL